MVATGTSLVSPLRAAATEAFLKADMQTVALHKRIQVA